ncbi:dTDP-4-keto-6-deoxy-D-glucose epimerase [Dietzia sp. DQ11-71]|nr:dTDP-4-dehydrorhamnose 3,5-epimerase [Dietzia sp. DQ11-71]MBB1017338.1 dTDP-4-keto-6-deoxy-D-glucose epimerase [Dietzia sp. DQ11-71]
MIVELSIPGAFVYTPKQFGDERGAFLEWFKDDAFVASTGHPLELAQANMSISAAGVLRGIHFADVPPGQAKYVTCAKGAVLDVVVDIRVGSPTFGKWESVLLDDVERKCIYLAEGLGHAFLSLEDESTVVYLCSSGYAPDREHGIDPFDEEIGIEWPTTGRNGQELRYELSAKDSGARSLSVVQESGLLPSYEDVTRYLRSLEK